MIRIYPSVFSGQLKAPASHAHAQRLLFMSSIPSRPTTVRNVPDCEDVDTTIRCLEALGCIVVRSGDSCTVTPFPKNILGQIADFNFGQSATSSRIAIALAGAFGIRANCKASGSLPRRKLFPLTGRMAIRGVRFSKFSLPFTMQGRLEPGEYVFEGNEGSQFISAILMALPLLPGPSTIKLASPLIDSSFVDLTIRSMAAFGVRIEKTDYGYYVPGRQYYESPGEISTENDWGLAALWVAAGAASGERSGDVIMTELPNDSPQLYRDVAKEFPFIAQDYAELDFDASTCPSLASFYAAMSAVKGATVTISGVPQLRSKESDRLAVMAEICNALGQKTTLTADGLHIEGTGKPEYPEDLKINCHRDPWRFMSMALASSKLVRPIILDSEFTPEKIYRNFLEDFKTLGGKYEIL
ncbi:MAG: hypothetical protein J5535_01315 [Firmicutes bacterium]|nr:hypothetical protein [Bacillota bacterium]